MPFCRRRISGSSATCSPVAASQMMAISGSTSSGPANAPYHASSHWGCWNGVARLGSFRHAAACFQSRTNSTRNRAARETGSAPDFTAAVVNTVIAGLPFSRRLRHVDDLAGFGGVEAEVDRAARAALTPDPAAVAQQSPHHLLGEVGWTAQVPALRLIAEAMAQQAVGEVDGRGATNFVTAVGNGHRDAEGVEVLHPMRRVERPAQHLAGSDIQYLGMIVVPGLVGEIDFDIEERDVFEMLRRNERRGVRVNIDALASGDLDQTLRGQVGVVIDLCARRRDQDAFLMAFRHLEAGYLGGDFLEHAIDQLAIAAIDRTDFAQVEPKFAAGDRVDHLAASEIADVAFAPYAA